MVDILVRILNFYIYLLFIFGFKNIFPEAFHFVSKLLNKTKALKNGR